MNKWKHKEWETFKGTWLVCSVKMTDEQIICLISSNPSQYGNIEDWEKQSV